MTKAQPVSPSRLEGKTHIFGLRVYYEDTDAGNIVYYANYLKFAERGRTEMLRAMGADHKTLIEKHGLMFVVRSCAIDYLAAAKLDEWLEVETSILAMGGATLDMQQIIRRPGNGEVCAAAAVKLVTLSPQGKVMKLPPALRQIIETLVLDDND
jgi:acyl-CoA thioester hydrolase